MKRRFHTLDVFTHTPLSGNPLAVVHDAMGLDGAAMQGIAREFNLSETVFVLPETVPGHRADIRIFTPFAELPFAGHPTVGTAVLLAHLDGMNDGDVRHFVLGLKAGDVPCTLSVGPRGISADFVAPRPAVDFGPPPQVQTLAAILGLAPDEIDTRHHQPLLMAAPVRYCLVPLRTRAALQRISADATLLMNALGRAPETSAAIYAYVRDDADPFLFHARMFDPAHGIAEDPATGSAAAAFVGAVERFEALRQGETRYRIRQGDDMGRPSLIALGVTIADRRVVRTTIGGGAVIVSEGTLSV